MTSNFADCLRDWEDLEKDYQHIQVRLHSAAAA